MRELTKSITSYTWAMSVFGFQQTLNLLGLGGSGSWNRSTQAFNNVTEATSNELGDTMRAVFRSGDTLQRGMVDLFLAPLGFLNGGNRVNGAPDNGYQRGPANGGRGTAARTGGWVDAATRMAQAGADAMQATVDATARTARGATRPAPPPQQPPPQPPSAPPSSDPSLGWGPMPR